MARDIPIGNGNLLVAFDETYQICDWYYPLVGQENHTAGHCFHFGIEVNQQFSWIDAPEWERHLDYEPHTMATAVTLRHAQWQLTIHATDVVDFEDDILLRRFRLENHSQEPQTIRLYFHHDFHVYGIDVGDTVFYDPLSESLIHYKDKRYFLMSGQSGRNSGIEQWATGRKEMADMEGTWRDAEDHVLEGNAIAQGSVDSTYSVALTVLPGQDGVMYTWVACAESLDDVRTLNGLVTFETPEALIQRTQAFWTLWLDRQGVDRGAPPALFEPLYERSLLITRTNCDNRGGIIAANDSDIMSHSRDTYSYVWPRDGAWVARALDVSGHHNLAERFFSFCANVIDSGGYFLHKYTPSGSLASSWHPWVLDGRPELPIQEDGTGLVLWALWEHFIQTHDVETVEPWLTRLVFPAGQFMADYRDPRDKLPWPSWELWEERRGIYTHTVASVYAGLTAAGHFAQAFGHTSRADTFYEAAQEVRHAALTRLVDPDGRLLRGLAAKNGTLVPDPTPDASLLLVPQLGLISPEDPMMVNTAAWVHDRLSVPGPIGGLARYEGDQYQRRTSDPHIPGNPWFICTLWYADYLIMRSRGPEDLQEPAAIISWVDQHALSSGVLAEQLDPESGAPLSVSPLTWSHAALILSIDRYREAQARFGLGPDYRESTLSGRRKQSIGY